MSNNKQGNREWGIGNRYCCTKNNSTHELYTGTTKKLLSTPFVSNLAPPFPIPHSLFPILIYLLFVSCNLFNAPKDSDYWEKIDEEIAWANAAKLDVKLSFPSKWGIANPQQGTITPAMDIRKGYAFSLEFTANDEYTLTEWRAYSSKYLDELDFEWIRFPELLDPDEQLENVILPVEVEPGGGKFSFKINTKTPVTLIPWCEMLPRITWTSPRNSDDEYLPGSTDIVIYFNSPLKQETVKFGDGFIHITATSLTDGSITDLAEDYFENEGYAYINGSHVVTLTSIAPAPQNSRIDVTIGRNIENSIGEKMAGPVTLSWMTWSLESGGITKWGAEYIETSNSIEVSWQATANFTVQGRYRVNRGADEELPASGIIDSIGRLNATGVLQGQPVSNIREYWIFLDLYDGSTRIDTVSFKIWNFPGMKVDQINKAEEISNRAQLEGLVLGDPNKKYVLVDDIRINGQWMPIGSGPDEDAFQGKLYGNWHTITLENVSFTEQGNTGLFGYLQNAQLSELTVAYSGNVEVRVSGAMRPVIEETVYIGGIAGFAAVESEITNSMARSINGATLSVDNEYGFRACLGGVAGFIFENGLLINNCFSDLNVKINGSQNYLYIGGISGRISGSFSQDDPFIGPVSSSIFNGVRALGNVDCSLSGTAKGYTGGIAGYCWGDTGILEDVSYGGTINNNSNSTGENFCGGITGYWTNPRFNNCVFEQIGTINVVNNNSTEIYVGGISGYLYNDNPSVDLFLSSCISRGDINIQSGAQNSFVGGVAACANETIIVDEIKILYKDCVYEKGTIYVKTGYIGKIYIGGFIGCDSGYGSYENCYSCAALIELDGVGGAYCGFGGFIGEGGGTLTNCGNESPLSIKTGDFSMLDIGGFAGLTGTIVNCWSLGSLSCLGIGEVTIGGLAGTAYKIINSWASGSVNVAGQHLITAGGLVGRVFGGQIEESWASGAVTVLVDDPHINAITIRIGGLIGYAEHNFIKNSYALGMIEADNPFNRDSIDIYIGGLIGASSQCTVQYSFAKGSAMARNASTQFSRVYAGGCIGLEVDSFTIIKNFVALGNNVIAKGGGTRGVAAIIQYNSTPNTKPINCFRSDFMNFGEADSYWDSPLLTPFFPTDTTLTYNGEAKDTRYISLWTDTNLAAFNSPEAGEGLWDTSSIELLGYPLLVNNRQTGY